MDSFKASTQYGDWEGTASADEVHDGSVHEYLQTKGLIEPGEFLIAASLYNSENSESLRAFVCRGDDFQAVRDALASTSEPVVVREIELRLTSEEFLSLFKRFSIMLTWHGLELEGRPFRTETR